MRLPVVLALAIASAGCGESNCQKFCDHVRAQLITAFRIPPSEVNCSDPAWDTNDCQQCFQILQDDFGVQVTRGTYYCESGGSIAPDGASDGATPDGGGACAPAVPSAYAFSGPDGAVIVFGSSCAGEVYFDLRNGFAFCESGVWKFTLTNPSGCGYVEL